MAGFFFKSGAEAFRPTENPDVRERAHVVVPREGLESVTADGGGFTDTLPVAVVSDRDRSGSKMRSFFETFYNRVYFLPSEVAFGAISGSVSREVSVWNARLAFTDLTAIGLSGADGVDLTGASVPVALKPSEILTYTISVSEDGPPDLNAAITFSFDTGQVYVLNATGARARLSPFKVNWRADYTIDYQFRTDIFRTRSGKEQRRSLRLVPRKTVTFTTTPTFAELRRFNELMASWQNNVIVLPELPRRVELGQSVDAGSLTVTLSAATPAWLVNGAKVVFATDRYSESRTVDSVAGSVVTFTGTTGQAWPAGAALHPALSGRMGVSVASRRPTDAVADATIAIEVTPGSEPVIAPAAPPTFNGREIFDIRPNMISPPTVTYESDRDTVDFSKGRIAVFSPVGFSTRMVMQTFTGMNYAEMDLITQHFFRAQGQRGEFYMPTWENDVVPSELSPAGSNTITVAGKAFADQYGGSPVYKAVRVQYRDGTVQNNVVEDIFVDEDNSGLQVTDAWTQDVSQQNVTSISWLLVWRHATDTLTVQWLTDTVAQCQMTMRTLEDLS